MPPARQRLLASAPPVVVLLAAVLAGCSSGPAAGPATQRVSPAAAPATSAAPAATTTPTATTSAAPRVVPSTVPPGARPTVDLALALRSAPGDPDVVVDVDATGFAPRGRGKAGPAAAVRGLRVDYGDGEQASVGGDAIGTVTCGKKARLGVLDLRRSLRHVYPRPGTYTLTVDVLTCRRGSTAARATSRDLRVVVATPPDGAQGVALDVQRTSPAGDRLVVLGARATGSAPRGAGTPGAAGAAVMGVAVDFGDGTEDDGRGTATACAAAATSAPLRFADERRHTYAKAGTWTVTYTLLTCTPGAATTTPTTRTLQVTVR